MLEVIHVTTICPHLLCISSAKLPFCVIISLYGRHCHYNQNTITKQCTNCLSL